MRKLRNLATTAATILLAATAIAATTGAAVAAAATPAPALAAAAVPVLSLGAPGGAAVPIGDVLTASLQPGSLLTLTTAPGGGVGLTCRQSSWSGAVVVNPALPGAAFINLLNPWLIAACADNAPTVTGVTGVTVSVLPNTLQVSGVAPFPIVIAPAPGPFQITVSLATTGGPVTCTYQASGALNGNATPGGGPWRFTNQPFVTVGAAPAACGAPNDFFTALYGPVIDTFAGSVTVFVN